MLKDQFLLSSRLNIKNIATESHADELEKNINQSILRAEKRQAALPEITYDESLPIAEKREEIKSLIRSHQVIVLSGETGSGKTTQIPKICMELGFGIKGFIGHTQPRRIAARTVANRIAEELKTLPGQSVGYKVRFSDHVGEYTHVKLMTDGILLAEIQNDRFLLNYEVIIIDEAHERSLNIDFLLGYLKIILKKRPDLKLIVTSATIDTEIFAKHFSDAPVIEVSGRTYPVEIKYKPLDDNEDDEPALPKAISNSIFELTRRQMGDTLVFLPGEREIREMAEYLRKHHPPHTEILPLYARLSVSEQEKIFKSHKGQRIVLTTNVAETSLTVPGIKYVIDSGLARVSRYSVRNRIQRLPIEPVSQAAANQRAGRCGRVSAGICIRLYSEQDFLNRPAFTDPEILRINLASAILQMIALKIGDIDQFEFLQTPETKYINDGKKLLFELGAVDYQHNLTATGKQISQLPVDPRIGKMILAASTESSLSEVLIIASFLSVQDPRDRPFEMQDKADLAHARFVDNKSDFLGILKLWEYFTDRSKHLSQSKLRKLCKQEFLSYLRLHEWKDIYVQLKTQVNELNLKLNAEPAKYEAIHRALLTGVLGNIGTKQEDGSFLGCSQKKFFVVPGSGQHAKPSKWVMAAEIVETKRNFARYVAKIEPEWITELASHLVNRNYFEPHWQRVSGQVAAFERVSLYGIVLIGKQRINYGPINPVESRQVFIRQALVDGEFDTREEFFNHNQKLIESIKNLENKCRRPDILVSEDEIFTLYDQQIPQGIYSSKAFHTWIRAAKQNNPQVLFFNQNDLMRESASFNETFYPDELPVESYVFPVRYRFDPAEDDDGVTYVISLELLNQIKAYWFEWLVPGFLHEKVVTLIKTLPKGLRKNFVPVPDIASRFIQSKNTHKEPLLTSLAGFLSSVSAVEVDADEFDLERIPNYLLASFELRDSNNKLLACSKDLAQLQVKYENQARGAFSKKAEKQAIVENIVDWDFDIPPFVEMKSPQGCYKAYPALQVVNDLINLNYFPNEILARDSMRCGLLALIKKKLGNDYNCLKRNLPDIDRQCLLYQKIAPCQELKDEIADFILLHQFEIADNLPVSFMLFQQKFPEQKSALLEVSNAIGKLNHEILQSFFNVQKSLRSMNAPQMLETLADITDQINHLVYRHYLKDVSYSWLIHYPRYFKAIQRRLEKLLEDPLADRKKMLQYKAIWQQYKLINSNNKKLPAANDLRWMIEEFRVSLFAQNLGTSVTVSEKRLKELLAKL